METIVETYIPQGEPSSAKRRVRPLAGQGFDVAMHVECSRSMREQYPAGSLFRLVVKMTSREGGVPFLYSNPRGPWETVSRAEAERFIVEQFRRNR
jgi:hypothetical protein